MAADHDVELSPEIMEASLQHARDSLAVQRGELESLYRRTENLMRLSVATLAGMIAAVGLIANAQMEIGVFGFLGFTTGIVVLFGAILMFVSVLTGFPGPIIHLAGPRLDQVQAGLDANRWKDLLAFEWAVFKGTVEAQNHQLDLHDRLSRRLATGIFGLAVGATVLLTTLAFILGGAIIG